MLVNPDVILGHMPIGEPFFEFAAATGTTDSLNFPHRFTRAVDILDDKNPVSPSTIIWGPNRDRKRLIVKTDDLLTASLSLERDAIVPKRC